MRRVNWLSTALTASVLLTFAAPAQADSLMEAMAKAYANSQSLNATRAQLRATDEGVPQAKSRLRPFVTGVAGASARRDRTTFGDNLPGESGRTGSLNAGIQINQVIFDGFQTPNNVAAAEAQIRASQANLANTVQNTLLDTVTVFMNVRRDREIAAFRRQNLGFLQEQVRASDARFEVGEGTRTDVAQSQAQQALATATLNSALAQVAVSEATYLDIVGDVPGELNDAVQPPAQLMPSSITAALESSQVEHPAIQANLFAVEVASFQVKATEGSLLPEVTVSGSVDNTYALSAPGPTISGGSGLPGVNINVATQNQISATVGAQVTVPIYQGGLASSQIRQAKEVLGQRRIEVDGARDEVRSAVASAWAQLQAARANVEGYNAQVSAAQLALGGVTEERAVGQRTTLDVLNAQADVLTAQILLAGARRDTVVAAYTLVAATGRLSADRLRLGVEIYDPEDHYVAVKDKWFGLRTPDGR